MLAGSNIRANQPFTASGPMSVPMPTQRWWRKLPSHRPMPRMAGRAHRHCLTTRVRSLPTVPVEGATWVMRCVPGVGYPGLSQPACGVGMKPRCLSASRPGTSRSIVGEAGSGKSSGHGSADAVPDACGGPALLGLSPVDKRKSPRNTRPGSGNAASVPFADSGPGMTATTRPTRRLRRSLAAHPMRYAPGVVRLNVMLENAMA